MRVELQGVAPQKERRMGNIVKKIKNASFTCEMCSKFLVGPRYIYESSFFKEYKTKQLTICKVCAKREHGPKNRMPLPELGKN